jgi:hypothetical protein
MPTLRYKFRTTDLSSPLIIASEPQSKWSYGVDAATTLLFLIL